jgi:hypothetical protein
LSVREEIQRIKAANPQIPHREAFSAAAKNVYIFHPHLFSYNYNYLFIDFILVI